MPFWVPCMCLDEIIFTSNFLCLPLLVSALPGLRPNLYLAETRTTNVFFGRACDLFFAAVLGQIKVLCGVSVSSGEAGARDLTATVA